MSLKFQNFEKGIKMQEETKGKTPVGREKACRTMYILRHCHLVNRRIKPYLIIATNIGLIVQKPFFDIPLNKSLLCSYYVGKFIL